MTIIADQLCVSCGKISPGARGRRWDEREPVDYRLDAPAEPEPPLYECAHCGHVAPLLREAYPGLDRVAHADVSGLHPEAARRVRVAALFADEDPREQGTWLLHAALREEEQGGDGDLLRRRAVSLLETSVQMGCALSRVRGMTAVILAECRRLLGDFEEARVHLARGILARLPDSPQKLHLFHTWTALDRGDRRPYTAASAERNAKELWKTEREAFFAALRGWPEPPALPLIPRRSWRGTYVTSELWRVFGADYLHPDHVLPLLRQEHHPTLAGAVRARRELLAHVIAAADVDRAAVVAFLQSPSLDLVSMPIPYEGPIAPLVRCLGDEAALTVRDAAWTLIRFLPWIAAGDKPGIIAAAGEALPRFSNDMSMVGVLEMLIERASG